ncbi:DUF3108 domain-containing protein [Viscerimonas tarda]
MKSRIVIFILLFTISVIRLGAQCAVDNKYFQAGEELTYDLYFKYGLVNKKAGISTLKTTAEKYGGEYALKMTMTARSVGLANKIFPLSDTLTCYMTPDLRPLAYIKHAHEGDEHSFESVSYDYATSPITIKAKLIRNNRLRFDETTMSESCIYDMMSIVYYARTLDYSAMRKGSKSGTLFLSGKNKVNMDIEYHGTEEMEANDGKKYNCIKLALVIKDKAFEDSKEAMKVFITNDSNRIPVRIDSKLKIGSTRVILKKIKGNKYPIGTL